MITSKVDAVAQAPFLAAAACDAGSGREKDGILLESGRIRWPVAASKAAPLRRRALSLPRTSQPSAVPPICVNRNLEDS